MDMNKTAPAVSVMATTHMPAHAQGGSGMGMPPSPDTRAPAGCQTKYAAAGLH